MAEGGGCPGRDGMGWADGRELSCPLREGEHPAVAKSACLLRTNCIETDPAKLWRWYMQLTQAKAAFQKAKSDIGLNLVFRQKSGSRLVNKTHESRRREE